MTELIWKLIVNISSDDAHDINIDTSSIVQCVETEVMVLEALEPHTDSLTHLSLQNYSGDRLPSCMPKSRLSSLRFLEIEGLRNIVGLPSLEELKVGSCLYLEEISIAAPALRLLRVSDCGELTRLLVHFLLRS